MKTYISFDTETTGFPRQPSTPLQQQPRVIELYAQKFVFRNAGPRGTFITLDEFHGIYNPGIRIPRRITEITGIGDDDLACCDPISDDWEAIRDFFRNADAVVAHNLRFDMQMMDIENRRFSHGYGFPWPQTRICTMEETRHFVGRRIKLQALHKYLFGKGFDSAHRAKSDTFALTRCFAELRKRDEITG